MLFPKPERQKKRKKHRKSILQEKDGHCYLCMKLHDDYRIHSVIHEHHVFGGANRAISEAEGFKVYLCLEHHVAGPEAVHNNQKNMRILQQDAEKIYEQSHSREEFYRLIGKYFTEGENNV